MILIRARARDHVDDRPAAVAKLRAETRLLNLEFLNGLDRRNIPSFLDTGIIIAVHDADTVQQQISLGVAAAIGNEVRNETWGPAPLS